LQGQWGRDRVVFSLGCICYWRDGWGENDQHKFWCGCKPWRAGTWQWRYPHKDTWCLDGSNALGRPQRHLALGSWQKARLTMAAPPPRGARVRMRPHPIPSLIRTCPRPTTCIYIIMCVMNIKNIIICVINIIIFLIINIINKFKKIYF
jgi:hypothetical protein